MPPIELELEQDGLLEMDLLGNFIGSAYAPQVDVTDTATGHEVAITYDDAEDGITTKTFDVDDGEQGADGYSPTATVTQLADGATISITDKDGTTTATVHDGIDGTDGTDGYSPSASVTQTASGATITITDESGTTTATVSNGADGTNGADGADGYSPTVSVSTITGGHEVTITDAEGAHTFEVMDGDPAEPGSITDAMLAPDGIKAQVGQLWGNQLKGTLTGDILTAADAYAAPPMALTVDGRSTQVGTPTPDAPVPIESVEGVELHASADGTTDYGGWPVTLDLDGHALRSLPYGLKDTLALTYLRPSTREGWAWYSRELVQMVGVLVLDGSESWRGNSAWYGYYAAHQADVASSVPSSAILNTHGVGAAYSKAGMESALGATGLSSTNLSYNWDNAAGTGRAPEFKAWLAENNMTVQYPLATPITTQLDPIELPVLPAPNCTVWADPTTGLQMEYVQDTNIVIASLEAAYADLATS